MRDEGDDPSEDLGSLGSGAVGSGPDLDGMRDALDPPPEVVDLVVRFTQQEVGHGLGVGPASRRSGTR